MGKALKNKRVESKANKGNVDVVYTKDSDNEENRSDSDMENETDESLHGDKSTSNAGWADAMQKILRTKKPKGKKTVVLAKAKKLCDVKLKKKEDLPFEIDDVKDEIKTQSEEASIETKEHVHKPRLKDKSLGIRVKPSITDREHERMLQKIATKGVVQLFNAVRQQQKEINKKLTQAGPLERKQEKVLRSIDKNSFLDILMGGSKSIPVHNTPKPEDPVEQTNDKEKDDKMWSVLREDFVMGAKLKDWDKKNTEEEEEEESASEDIEMD